jgi:plastocyanin
MKKGYLLLVFLFSFSNIAFSQNVTHYINAGSYYYSPSSLTINSGDTIVWLNDGGFHNVNFISSTTTGLSFGNPESFISSPTNDDTLYTHVFTLPGTYNYDCSVGSHASNGMTGSLIVNLLIYGCTDSLASNYNPFASVEDSTCLYSPFIFGCTDIFSFNFDSLANINDSSCCYDYGQNWTQIGQDIDGESAGDRSGRSVSLSSDGNTVAIGAQFNGGNGYYSGHVRIYENIAGNWTQIGQDLDGENPNDFFGYSVSINSDGSIVAIGATDNSGSAYHSGHVRVFENIAGSWTQIGQDIDGEAFDDKSGQSVSISSDGSIVAIGAYLNDNPLSHNSGHVRVFENIGGNWTQIGQDIDGENSGDWSGHEVSISGDGNIVAIGSIRNNDNGNWAGQVRIYENISGTWTQKGQDLEGDSAYDEFGWTISLNFDGSIVGIGTYGNCYVKIYEDSGGVWSSIGQDITENCNWNSIAWFGIQVSLSLDGSKVAIGAKGSYSATGAVIVYENNNSSWDQIGPIIIGENIGDRFGRSLSLSGNGNTVAIGGNFNNGNGSLAGHVRVHYYDSTITSPCPDLGCLDPLALNFDPFANTDDSTCIFPNYGCIDSTALNFNIYANVNDGSCVLPGPGCTDSLASNYNPFASVDDSTCLYSAFIFGCTDPSMSNYNLNATHDDSSCCNTVQIKIGQDIDGESVGDNNGYSVSYSMNSNIVAVGAPYNDGNGSNSGYVRIYENISGIWNQIGQDIEGAQSNDNSGYSISLNSYGNIVAIGSPNGIDANGAYSGHVRVYENIDGSWTQIGLNIDAAYQAAQANDKFGSSLSLSADGNTVAIGAPYAHGNNYNDDPDRGRVRIYKNISGVWTIVHQSTGINDKDYYGNSVSLSSDGNTVAIGALMANINNPSINYRGAVYIRQNSPFGNINYSQIWQYYGSAAEDMFGYSVSISSDGSIVAVGARNNDDNGTNSGQVRVFEKNILGPYYQIGQDINGESAQDNSGYSISLRPDGASIAIGAPYNAGNGSNSGHVRIYENIGGTWIQFGSDIDGESAYDYSGSSVNLTYGNTVAVGARDALDTNGIRTGHVRVFGSDPFVCDSLGCLDPLALNFDPFAYVDDSTCIYPIYGCSDILAFNYDSLVNINDNSICIYGGCKDTTALNYS